MKVDVPAASEQFCALYIGDQGSPDGRACESADGAEVHLNAYIFGGTGRSAEMGAMAGSGRFTHSISQENRLVVSSKNHCCGTSTRAAASARKVARKLSVES
ncbi:MAG: hypothetical protein P8J17_04635 [Halioglobus sp.]|nr:hypothetical protein [Halioglobus sp.]